MWPNISKAMWTIPSARSSSYNTSLKSRLDSNVQANNGAVHEAANYINARLDASSKTPALSFLAAAGRKLDVSAGDYDAALTKEHQCDL